MNISVIEIGCENVLIRVWILDKDVENDIVSAIIRGIVYILFIAFVIVIPVVIDLNKIDVLDVIWLIAIESGIILVKRVILDGIDTMKNGCEAEKGIPRILDITRLVINDCDKGLNIIENLDDIKLIEK